ncbi:MAG TPA: rhomboid family intramembrane serine protease [Thermoanaerobaculia bacterium]|jgi:membrane associated rhomboid family serine protease|nr:rhomboid family intramembrane serine protease [Thermoanaerobaculia bacterium]
MRNDWKDRGATLTSFVGAMWVVRIADAIVPGFHPAVHHGIEPRAIRGLDGIVFAPFIHADFPHLLANTLPLLILGAIALLRGRRDFVFVAVASALIGGAGTWLFGAGDAAHVGASGIIFGLFGYLVFRTVFDRRWSSAIVTVVVILLYGSAMLASLIPEEAVSWSGHFFGFAGGVFAARVRHSRAGTR